jgi:hypothetical protein
MYDRTTLCISYSDLRGSCRGLLNARYYRFTISNTIMSQTQQLAVVVGSDKTSLSVKSIDVPIPEVDEVLVKVHAAAQNPTDCL